MHCEMSQPINLYHTMTYTKDFSIIVPTWRGAIKFLPKLFDSIPEKEGIEIIVVDNSKEPVCREEIMSDRDIIFLHSAPGRHAGGSRNEGMDAAHGKWLVFADADDYFTEKAFDVFDSHINSPADVIYFTAQGIYEDGSYSTRGDQYKRMVGEFLRNPQAEFDLRTCFSVPWAKMVRREFVEKEKIRFDEVVAANDAFFSLQTGFLASKVEADEKVVYMVTTSKGSLTKRKDLAAIRSRYMVGLRKNRFLKDHGRPDLQASVMVYIIDALHIGIKPFFSFIWQAIKYKQNLLIGMSRWFGSYKKKRQEEKKDKDYYTK